MRSLGPAELVAVHRAVPVRPCPRSPWRTGRAAAWPGCSGARRPGRRARAPGSRNAGRADAGQITVPDEPVHLVQGDPSPAPSGVEQAQLHPLRDAGEQGEVGPDAVVGRAQRIRCRAMRPPVRPFRSVPVPPRSRPPSRGDPGDWRRPGGVTSSGVRGVCGGAGTPGWRSVKVTSTHCSGRRWFCRACSAIDARSASASGGCTIVRGQSRRVSTTFNSAAYTVTWTSR